MDTRSGVPTPSRRGWISLRPIFPDINFTDIILGDENGLKVLEKVNELKLHSPVIMITGQPSIDYRPHGCRTSGGL